MTPFTLYTPQTAKPEAAETFDAVIEQMGFLPHVLAQMGNTPPSVTGFVTLNQMFSSSSLSATEREIVQLVVSMENSAPYCVAAHTSFARTAGVDMALIETVRSGALLTDKKLQALQIFTLQLVRSRGSVSQTDLNDFFNAGYTADQVFEVILGITFKFFSNLASNASRPPLDVEFAPFAWTTVTPDLDVA
jgi:uncharacterized peroxidase-related enzyme